jgi:hypothetical protein
MVAPQDALFNEGTLHKLGQRSNAPKRLHSLAIRAAGGYTSPAARNRHGLAYRLAHLDR